MGGLMKKQFTRLAVVVLLGSLGGCSAIYNSKPLHAYGAAQLQPTTNYSRDLDNLPAPKLVLPVAVYSFKDQTGQFKSSPESSFSTALSQGGTAMLIKALKDSTWFVPLERENIQDVLNERKIVRAIEQADDKGNEESKFKLPNLVGAGVVIEGSIIGYDSNVKTGGVGVKWLGLSLSQQYRADQVTVNLRAVDITSGVVMETITTSKTIYSTQLDSGEYRYVNYQSLLQVELGTSLNEPSQIALQEAIEAGVVNLIVEGIYDKKWQLKNDADRGQDVIKRYRAEQCARFERFKAMDKAAADKMTTMSPANVSSMADAATRPVTAIPVPTMPVPAPAAPPAPVVAPAGVATSGKPAAGPAAPGFGRGDQ